MEVILEFTSSDEQSSEEHETSVLGTICERLSSGGGQGYSSQFFVLGCVVGRLGDDVHKIVVCRVFIPLLSSKTYLFRLGPNYRHCTGMIDQ